MTYHKTYLRLFCLGAAFSYLLFSAGLSRPFVETVVSANWLKEHKCAGNGCACDNAGYELPGCACEDENSSCHLEEVEPKVVESSCCSSSGEETLKDNYVMKGGCGGGAIQEGVIKETQKEILFVDVSSPLKIKTSVVLLSKITSNHYLSPEIANPDKIPWQPSFIS